MLDTLDVAKAEGGWAPHCCEDRGSNSCHGGDVRSSEVIQRDQQVDRSRGQCVASLHGQAGGEQWPP